MSVTKRLQHKRIKKSANWFSPQVHTKWHKTMPANKRRDLVLKAHRNNALSSARAMQALANVTTDRQTKKLAHSDAVYFYAIHNKSK